MNPRVDVSAARFGGFDILLFYTRSYATRHSGLYSDAPSRRSWIALSYNRSSAALQPGHYFWATLLAIIAVFIASYVPARRAALLAPVATLRGSSL
ncbi:MAG: hypothetical protein ABR589_01675 [Chthoniobacterales bacterium]